MLAAAARPLIPLLERGRGTRYLVEGTTITAISPVLLPGQKKVMELRRPLWVAAHSFGLPLVAALILATPGWSRRRRARALGIGLLLITLSQLAFLVVQAESTQHSPIETQFGRFTMDPSSSWFVKYILFDWFSGFFAAVGHGFFALLIYWGLLAFTWGRPDAPGPAASVGRNDPCPCGSGRKAKRCCGA